MAEARGPPHSAVEANESNLTLLDTVNPAIRDLAVTAGDEATYADLNIRNKLGVFFSEGLNETVLPYGLNIYSLNLLSPWEEKHGWEIADFIDSSGGPMFLTDGKYYYQPLPSMPWKIAGNVLYWPNALGVSHPPDDFFMQLNNHPTEDQWGEPESKVKIYKRFEFPTDLKYIPKGSNKGPVQMYDIDRAEISSEAKKLVIVIHGWNPEPDTDPYASGNPFASGVWPVLISKLSTEIKAKSTFAPGWDLYAYRWGSDSYTGNLNGNGGAGSIILDGFKPSPMNLRVNGGVGVGVENGTQAAEIGYQHGLVLGKLIRDHCAGLEKVHFIAHSAGVWVARSASLYLNATKGAADLHQQITLLDPYNPNTGKADWIASGYPANVDDSVLDTAAINNWASTVQPERCENIYSDDKRIAGTNVSNYWEGIAHHDGQQFENLQVGASEWGLNDGEHDWGAHSGPIRYYSFSIDPRYNPSLVDRIDSWEKKTKEDIAVVGWEHSLFMEEYKTTPWPFPINSVVSSGFAIMKTSTPPILPRSPSIPAPPTGSPWKQILVDVDENGWVRAMLVPEGGGAAVLAGPTRVEPDGTFAINLSNSTVLAGSFDASVTPVAVSLTLDGALFGQKVAKAQGAIAQTGIDANVNAAGNGVFSIVLADGTTGMAVTKDTTNTGWEASGVGVVDATGVFSVTGENGLQITGQLQSDGGLDTQATTVVPPLVPKIYVQNVGGSRFTSGASSADCGNVQLGFTSSTLAITIKNTGTVALTDLGVSIDGANSADFVVSALGTTSLDPETSVTFSVTFRPAAVGDRTAALHIASNDTSESPFDVGLTGHCFSATAFASETSGIAGELSAGGEEFFRVPVSSPGILIAWTEGSTDTYGAIFNGGGVVLAEDNDSDLQANFRTSASVVAGDYFVSVSGFDASIAGPYTLRTRFIPASEPIQISFLEKAGDDVNLGFTSVAGESYSILGSDDMIEWAEITTATGNGAEMLVALPWHGVFPRRFFRVSTLLP